jgi:molybdopterin synthase sulfur carrier subunit
VVKLLFFGRLSDYANGVPTQIQASTAAEIRQQLATEYPLLATELSEPQVLVAVNKQIVDWQQALQDGDEVAFLPPVTGG